MDGQRGREQTDRKSDIRGWVPNLKRANTLFTWFNENLLKVNSEKSHLPSNSTHEIHINIGEMAISNSKCKTVLGSHIDNKLVFKLHVRPLWKKTNQKLDAFARIAYSLKF